MSLVGEVGRFGVIADVSGAVLIAKSVFYKKNKDIFARSAMVYGPNHYLSKEAIKAKYEAIIGCLFLSLGFIGQYVGSFKYSRKPVYSYDILFALVCAVLVLATIYFSRKIASGKTTKLAEKYAEDNKPA